ncbi:ABC transporter substrate-binding protein [Anaerosporobacter sp.]
MKRYRRMKCLWLVILLVISLIGCNTKKSEEKVAEEVISEDTKTTDPSNKDETSDTILFTDSAGREVEIPSNITRIAASGSLAQIVLFSVDPDKLIGLASEFSDNAKSYIDEKYYDLPILGQFYGQETFSAEAVVNANPQVIIDIGETKDTIEEDMDTIQKQTGIPTIFIEATLETMPTAYRTLGELLDKETECEELATYCEDTWNDAKEKSDSIKEEDRVKVFYAEGDTGLQTEPKGSIHADVIDLVGATNVTDIESTSSKGLEQVSMEQIMLWDPDVILFAPDSIYSSVKEDKTWSELDAVKYNRVYEIPIGPYNWMGRPPSINRIIGIKWLGNLLYPDIFDYDMVEETQKFYKLFYHSTISEEQAKELMSYSTFIK